MDGVSRAMTSQYDAGGNRILLTGDQGYSAPFSYDGLGRMSAYANLALFAYDTAGRRSSLAMGPGWTSSTTGYGYDPVGRLATLTHDLSGTSADQSQGFAYNPASQVVTRSGSNDAYAWTGSVAVNRPYSVNGQNQYIAAGPASFTYDANGNLTSDGSSAFVYDSENRLVSASGAKTAALAYDPLGRLWQVTSSASTTRFLYDGDRLVMEYNGAGAVTRSYVHGPGADEPLVWYESTAGWASRFLHADHQGSIVALNDDNGNLVAINAYDEYGVPKPDQYGNPGAGNTGRFQYTGQAWIPELGMYYYKARIYSPTLGRFMQVDPIGYEDQVNLYTYVANDPVNLTDSNGEIIDTIADIAFIVADVADISRNGINWTNGVSLGANIVGAAIPGMTGLGAGTRGIARIADKGLAGRGVRPSPGSRTINGQVRNAVNRAGGNPTIRRNGQDLVRLRPSGHGKVGPTATPQNVRNVSPRTGQAYTGRGPDRDVTKRDMRELYKARDGQGTNSCRTRAGGCVNLGQHN